MATNKLHLNRFAPAILAIAAALIAAPQALASYQWPVKPFDRAHPVRANFGDPRMKFYGQPSPRTLLTGSGNFSFHFGIDISAPDGTAVYPVRSGTATRRNGSSVAVDSDGGFSTQYWHIRPMIRTGDHVEAGRTVLGYITKGHEHVHFTEEDHGTPVNPLAAGHLAPYADHTRPTVAGISFRRSDSGRDVAPEFVRGSVLLIANVYDTPALPVPGMWGNLPVAPATVSWRIERIRDGRVVIPEHTAFDVRRTIPSNGAFWSYYARGSRQNMTTFGNRRFWFQPGVYLYKLMPTRFDTRRLRNGVYRVVVTAADTGGNRASASQVVTILN